MDTMGSVYACDDVGVFWNMVDFPISEDVVDRVYVFEDIRHTLAMERCGGHLDIWGYVEEDTPNCDVGGILYNKGDISYLTNRMIIDILFWAMKTSRPSNLFIIAKDIVDEFEFLDVLVFLKSKGFNVVLVDAPPPPPPDSDEVDPYDDEEVPRGHELHGIVNSIWPLKRLLDGIVDE